MRELNGNRFFTIKYEFDSESSILLDISTKFAVQVMTYNLTINAERWYQEFLF